MWKVNSLIQAVRSAHFPNERYSALLELSSLGTTASSTASELETLIRREGDANFVSLLVETLEKVAPNRYSMLNPELNLDLLKAKTVKVPIRSQLEEDAKIPEPSIEIELHQTGKSLADEDFKTYRKCNFCEQEMQITNKEILNRLNPPGTFHCAYCLRNSLHTRKAKETMVLSFRAIFGYFYYELFLLAKTPAMYASEIDDYLDLHAEIGKRNPLFDYNENNCLWFVDFTRVGNSKKKLPVRHVYRTIVEILAGLNLTYNVKDVKLHLIYQKYQEAVQKFYESRYRPEGQKLCIPTLKNCGITTSSTTSMNPLTGGKFVIEDTRNFLPYMLSEAYPRQKCNPF